MSSFAESGLCKTNAKADPNDRNQGQCGIGSQWTLGPLVLRRGRPSAQIRVSVSEHCYPQVAIWPDLLPLLIQSFSGNGREHGSE